MLRSEHVIEGDRHLFGLHADDVAVFLQNIQAALLVPCYCASFLFCAQRFEAGDDIEQFLVDTILAQTMKCPVEVLQQFVDVFVGALHRRQAARVLASEGFGTRPEERDEKIFADERPQGRGAATHDLGQVSGRPGEFGQLASPGFVQRQQSLTDGLIDRPGSGAVVEEVKFGDFTLAWCASLSTRICPTSGVMALTEFGTVKSPISGRPASARRA